MDYLDHLLPNEDFCEILIDEDVCSFFLLRRLKTSDPNQECRPGTESLKFNSICRSGSVKEALDFSVNISSQFFGLNELAIKIVGEKSSYFAQYCEIPYSSKEVPPVYGQDFILLDSYGCCHFKIDDILKVGPRVITALDGQGNVVKEDTVKPIVLHTPAKWNFWHFSVRWAFDNEGEFKDVTSEEIDYKTGEPLTPKGIYMSMKERVKAILTEKARFGLPAVHLVLPKEKYCKSA